VTVLVDVNDEALGGNIEMGAMYVLLVTKQHLALHRYDSAKDMSSKPAPSRKSST
jgi:hypothetical protein